MVHVMSPGFLSHCSQPRCLGTTTSGVTCLQYGSLKGLFSPKTARFLRFGREGGAGKNVTVVRRASGGQPLPADSGIFFDPKKKTESLFEFGRSFSM